MKNLIDLLKKLFKGETMKKRILSFILVLALALGVLPLSIFAQENAENTSASSDESVTITNGDYSLTVNKTKFEVGEDIVASVQAPNPSSDWIGIYTVDGISAVLWDYVSTQGTGTSFVANDMTQKSGAWADWHELPEGRYFLRLMKNGSSDFANSACTIPIIIGTPDVVEGDSSLMSIEKTEFLVGEPIMVSAIGDGTDWVGFYYPGIKTSARYHYVSEAKGGPGSGVAKDVRNGQSFGVGDYIVRLMPNDSTVDNSGNPNASAYVLISIVESYDDISTADKFTVEAGGDIEDPETGGGTTDPENPETGGGEDPENPDIGGGEDPENPDTGDTEHDGGALTVTDGTRSMSVNKTRFATGEEILVTAIALADKDWIGIAPRDYTDGTIRWYYIKDAGNGVEYNLRGAPNIGGNLGDYKDIPDGLYTIYFVENDQYLRNGYKFSINISVGDVDDTENGKAEGGSTSGEVTPSGTVVSPESAEYAPTGNGYATGTVTVTMPTEALNSHNVVMFWADANGPLEGYTEHARFKVSSTTVSYTFSDSVIIPNGATRLLVYSEKSTSGELSEEFISIDLPQNSEIGDLGTPKGSFFAISDTHIGSTYGAKHLRLMLKDAIALYPNGVPIYISGDITDHGYASEYEEFMSIFNETMAEAGADPTKYPLYLAIGNHDYPSATGTFLQYATLPDGTHPSDTCYDFWLNGYHYIFLGGDNASGLEASFTEETLAWLDSALAENRSEERPIFIFLHQPMYNTVSGSLPGEGWDGVTNEADLQAVISKYPEIVMFNGHTHWEMNSKGNVFEGTEALPIHAFNCASVSYLWTAFNITSGENLYGSQGYIVDLYDGRIVVRGRDFIDSEWIASAQYSIEFASECEHDYKASSVQYSNGYGADGIIASVCSKCGGASTEICEPIIRALGYSVKENTGNGFGICAGYAINHEMRALFESLNEATIEIGVAMFNCDFIEGESFFENGIIASDKARLQVEMISDDYSTVNIYLSGIDEDLCDLDLALCAYVNVIKSGEEIKTGLVQGTPKGAVSTITKSDGTLSTVSYNSLK
ncbi:MAG: hypothetical protein E7622_04200 [Ruminococcaceae bacterium]|nr:hypothetical protein [Oscillospiraceae bacterium]